MKLIERIRRIARKIIRNSGFQRKIAPDFVDVMNENNIDVVIDVGANDGDYGRDIRDRGYKGVIVSFEPNPKVFSRLKELTIKDPNWFVYPFALGDANRIGELSIALDDTMSSFKLVNDFGKLSGARPINKINIDIMRLDDFLKNNSQFCNNIYLKIDTQGYEMEVLLGAGEYLKNVIAVQAEIALIHTYQDEMDWLAIVTWLKSNRFELVTAICNSTLGARVREFDFVFINNRIR